MAGVKGRSGGRNKKSVQMHVVSGTYRPDRHTGPPAPDPTIGRPRAPKTLRGDAKREWRRMIHRLEHTRVLALVDDAVLYQYCRLFEETEGLCERQSDINTSIRLIEERLDKLEGDTLVAALGEINKLRQLQASFDTKIRQGRALQRVFLVEFGLTPAARTRVAATAPEPPKTNNPADRYLNAIPGGRRNA